MNKKNDELNDNILNCIRLNANHLNEQVTYNLFEFSFFS